MSDDHVHAHAADHDGPDAPIRATERAGSAPAEHMAGAGASRQAVLGRSTPRSVLRLQRAAGNRAVGAMLTAPPRTVQRDTTTTAPPPVPASVSSPPPTPAPAAGVALPPPPAPPHIPDLKADGAGPDPVAPTTTPTAADPPGHGFVEQLGAWQLFPRQVYSPPGSPWKWDAGKKWEFAVPLGDVPIPVEFGVNLEALAGVQLSFGPGMLTAVRIRRDALEQAEVAAAGPLSWLSPKLRLPPRNAKGAAILSVPAAAGGRVRVTGTARVQAGPDFLFIALEGYLALSLAAQIGVGAAAAVYFEIRDGKLQLPTKPSLSLTGTIGADLSLDAGARAVFQLGKDKPKKGSLPKPNPHSGKIDFGQGVWPDPKPPALPKWNKETDAIFKRTWGAHWNLAQKHWSTQIATKGGLDVDIPSVSSANVLGGDVQGKATPKVEQPDAANVPLLVVDALHAAPKADADAKDHPPVAVTDAQMHAAADLACSAVDESGASWYEQASWTTAELQRVTDPDVRRRLEGQRQALVTLGEQLPELHGRYVAAFDLADSDDATSRQWAHDEFMAVAHDATQLAAGVSRMPRPSSTPGGKPRTEDNDLVLRAIQTRGGIIPFLDAMARRLSVDIQDDHGNPRKVDFQMFLAAWNDPTTKDRLKTMYREAAPNQLKPIEDEGSHVSAGGMHEWIPTNYVPEVVARANDAYAFAEGAYWIHAQNDLRSPTKDVIYNPRGELTVRQSTGRLVLQGHPGVDIYFTTGKGGALVQQNLGTVNFHNALRQLFSSTSSLAVYLALAAQVAEALIWGGVEELANLEPGIEDGAGSRHDLNVLAARQQNAKATMLAMFQTVEQRYRQH